MTTVPCPCCEGSAKLDLTTMRGLRTFRMLLGLSGKDMANRLNLQPQTFSNYEHERLNGKRSRFPERYRRALLAEFRAGGLARGLERFGN